MAKAVGSSRPNAEDSRLSDAQLGEMRSLLPPSYEVRHARGATLKNNSDGPEHLARNHFLLRCPLPQARSLLGLVKEWASRSSLPKTDYFTGLGFWVPPATPSQPMSPATPEDWSPPASRILPPRPGTYRTREEPPVPEDGRGGGVEDVGESELGPMVGGPSVADVSRNPLEDGSTHTLAPSSSSSSSSERGTFPQAPRIPHTSLFGEFLFSIISSTVRACFKQRQWWRLCSLAPKSPEPWMLHAPPCHLPGCCPRVVNRLLRVIVKEVVALLAKLGKALTASFKKVGWSVPPRLLPPLSLKKLGWSAPPHLLPPLSPWTHVGAFLIWVCYSGRTAGIVGLPRQRCNEMMDYQKGHPDYRARHSWCVGNARELADYRARHSWCVGQAQYNKLSSENKNLQAENKRLEQLRRDEAQEIVLERERMAEQRRTLEEETERLKREVVALRLSVDSEIL
ncbi:unnamed protein product [Cuscuta campestris]|uniref:Uncharacterized protein n=1 Tax=Cuscuta campestris TaxID=132261 RepID=A0A484K598_9ASTE|nr:unnamed protein product [Cuscuta campestris]